ncbi:CO/xanthine dehydrogenase FAD-binding subunit [Bradyrhizobium sp. LM6.9]
MRPFSYQRATDPDLAVQALSAAAAANNPLTQAAAQPLAGGTTLIDLMKLDVMRPAALVDINPLARGWSAIESKGDGLRLGALAKMSDVAAHAEIQRNYPVIANSLNLAASAQLRNMATLGGNVMQRSRVAATSATSPMRIATSAILARAVPPWMASIACMRCSVRPISVSRPIPAILPRR